MRELQIDELDAISGGINQQYANLLAAIDYYDVDLSGGYGLVYYTDGSNGGYIRTGDTVTFF